MAKPRLLSNLLLAVCLFFCAGSAQPEKQAYVVYMGAASTTQKSLLRSSHLSMLESAVGSYSVARKSLIYSYTHSINGFSAILSSEEANIISSMEGVVSVFASKMHKLHTTRSWDFLESLAGDLQPMPQNSSQTNSDVIIGMLDTGIWPESQSFNDKGMSPVPSKWKGKCVNSSDFNATNCNKKLIGARYYSDGLPFSTEHDSGYLIYGGPAENLQNISMKRLLRQQLLQSPRDTEGHGTHTASTAGGREVQDASYYGLAKGTARGGAPLSRIAVYKVCTEDGCSDADILAAYDDAISDGVDVLSLSLGAPSFITPHIVTDGVAIGAFHAVQNGILVVCSAGNDGPSAFTVVNTVPWILTVGASTVDRSFETQVTLGNNRPFPGIGMNYLSLKDSYKLVFGGDIAAPEVSNTSAGRCVSDSLDATKAKGKVILCFQSSLDESTLSKSITVKQAGGVGMIIAGDIDEFSPSIFELPATEVSQSAGTAILQYIKSTSEPTATISPAKTKTGFKPAPVVAKFSGRGPNRLTENILKPDIIAPGLNILAAWTGKMPYTNPPAGQKPSPYAIISGTSMSCPHVSGAAAFLKSLNPNWTASALKSAIMTTATTVNNEKEKITNTSGGISTWFETGAGELNPSRAADPGLIYEMDQYQHYLFLCYYGLNTTQIAAISANKTFSCPPNSNSTSLISTLNYPSISVSNLTGTLTLPRTLTNVGPANSTYHAKVVAPDGLNISVNPSVLEFSTAKKRINVEIQMTVTGAPSNSYVFGSISFSDGIHDVVTPLVVRPLSA
eukprot:TRINITY_DN10667_c0_g1_i1.p1 TRINITY_DN10667_c0_g1~~TRINITY_DN10667_c0_g1_i1.p1  ORF type:complete len:789 (-),score=55.03 TRINITY_DN10667_c0_g1_i1:217-2583(-)